MRAQVAQVAKRPYWREGDARVVVEAWRRTGASIAAFADRHGIVRQRLARWAARLKGAEAAGTYAGTTPVQFHPVLLTRQGDALARSIEIELRDGRRVRVARGFDPEDLRRVLALLGEQPTC